MTPARQTRPLVPAYMALGGRAEPGRNTLDSVSLLSAAVDRVPPGLDPARHRIVELLCGGPLSLAEVAAHVRLPVGVVKVLVSDLIDEGRLRARAPVPRAEQLDAHLLERVLSGLRAIQGE
ncbi:DUF742 domain-containing protein [Streptomyces pactum]|uniref:DUF742 domain-containing protein n=1 Tax=Streptomyces pactum TaxID=68249 RepID=A0ABS0NPH1_9ACTN|nr:DUF742 domain-containing protein [Streptomyces pactum]MBH5337106.1 DUF742 domain-containing protein [Streptomyces pactum]